VGKESKGKGDNGREGEGREGKGGEEREGTPQEKSWLRAWPPPRQIPGYSYGTQCLW